MINDFRLLTYNSANSALGNTSDNAVFKDGTIWLTQKAMAELFGVQTPAINKHLKNIFEEGELEPDSAVSKMKMIQSEENTHTKRVVDLYNLNAIISVGYRVNSSKATHFRAWATGVLKEYMTKGFAMNDERLKQGKTAFDQDYFDELLERIQSIRASERRIWQKITDIFAECSTDYDKNSDVTHDFYTMVYNKFYYAITRQTATDILYSKADQNKDHIGLTSCKHVPEGRILKSDVTVVKQHLEESEIKQLEGMMTGYFDYIEDLIERGKTFTMEQFAESVKEFLDFREYRILPNKGKVSV